VTLVVYLPTVVLVAFVEVLLVANVTLDVEVLLVSNVALVVVASLPANVALDAVALLPANVALVAVVLLPANVALDAVVLLLSNAVFLSPKLFVSVFAFTFLLILLNIHPDIICMSHRITAFQYHAGKSCTKGSWCRLIAFFNKYLSNS
jgi:hypothetical protein